MSCPVPNKLKQYASRRSLLTSFDVISEFGGWLRIATYSAQTTVNYVLVGGFNHLEKY